MVNIRSHFAHMVYFIQKDNKCISVIICSYIWLPTYDKQFLDRRSNLYTDCLFRFVERGKLKYFCDIFHV